MYFVKITKCKLNNYYGLKLGDVCPVVGTKKDFLVVTKFNRNIKSNIRPFVTLKNDCKYQTVKVNIFYKLLIQLSLCLVNRVVNQVNTKGITPLKK